MAVKFEHVLVTGGAGFLGSYLCERLLAADCDVICVDNFYTGNADNDIHLEVPLERNVLIRQASFDDVDRRPVVVFDVKLGDNLHQPTEFTLADRSRMSYPVLLGRSFLKDVAVVDVGQEFIHPRSKKR